MRALLLAALLVPAAAAQKAVAPVVPRADGPGECAVGEAEAELDVAGVRARLYNFGGLFWRGAGPHYEVPRGSDKVAIFTAGLWLGGLVDGELRFAGSAYGPWEYWPGPLDAGAATTPEQCAALDRIWTVAGADLDAFEATGAATADLREWPVAWGAPFFVDADGDGAQGPDEPTVSLDLGDPGYGTKALDLGAGERPVVFGRQTAWWVMNDAGGPHEWGGTDPLGVEVRVTAWARGGEGEPELYESTFYRYEVINRSASAIDDARAALFVDADLGNFNDDYFGTSPERSLAYAYNGDREDEGSGGYGALPPALGVDILSGGSSAMGFIGGGAIGDPGNASEAWTFMQGLWKDGTPMKVGGDGYNTNGPVTRWAFDGVPPEFWSEYDLDGLGNASVPSDRQWETTAELGRIEPGGRAVVDLAILFAQTADTTVGRPQIGSVRELFAVSDAAQALYDAGALAARVAEPVPPAGAPALVAPAAGASLDDGAVAFAWGAVPGTTDYRLEVAPTAAFDTLYVEATVDSTAFVVERGGLPFNRADPLVWRVTPENLGVVGPPSEARAFRYFRKAFSSIEVVANASGLIDAHPGGPAFRGFPTPGGENPDHGTQQTNGTVWFLGLGTAPDFDGTFTSFLDGSGFTAAPGRVVPHDLEVRFTGPTTAYRAGQDGALVEIPFEVWDTGVGTPDDPSDDVRLVVAIDDRTPDGTAEGSPAPDGRYGLVSRDSPMSTADNDPATDWTTWLRPLDETPGDAGYRAWLAGAEADPTAHGDTVLARTAFVAWNLGYQPPYAAEHPEAGTVFRLVTSDLLGVAGEPGREADPLALAVGPNPVRGVATVRYTVLTAGPVRLRVVDVLGREVAQLADGEVATGVHSAILDASRLAAGVYLIVLDADGARAARTVTVAR